MPPWRTRRCRRTTRCTPPHRAKFADGAGRPERGLQPEEPYAGSTSTSTSSIRLARSSSCARPSSSTATPRTASAKPGRGDWPDRQQAQVGRRRSHGAAQGRGQGGQGGATADHCSVPVDVVPGQGLHEQKGINPGEDANRVRQGECESRACICDYKLFNIRLACSSSCERPSSSMATPRTASAREPGHENWLDRHEPNRP